MTIIHTINTSIPKEHQGCKTQVQQNYSRKSAAGVSARGGLVVRTRLPMNPQGRIKVSSAGIAEPARETRCGTGRKLHVQHPEKCSTSRVAASAPAPQNLSMGPSPRRP